MSSITLSQSHLDREQEGELTLELVAVRYTGDRSSFDVTSHLSSAGWPKATPLNGGTAGEPGPWYMAFTPDHGLGTLENRNDLEVVYGDQQERFAGILLEQRRLPGNAFGRGADQRLRDRVFDVLGLGDPVSAGPVKQQLQDLAGVDPTEDSKEDDTEDQSLVETLVDTYSRSELGDVAKALREDTEAFDLRANAKKRDRAEFIAGFDEGERAAALPEQGGDD